MKRIVRDALLVAGTAVAVWVARGEAQEPTVSVVGPVSISCNDMRLIVSVGGSDALYTELNGAPAVFSGAGAPVTLTDCLILTALPTPTP